MIFLKKYKYLLFVVFGALFSTYPLFHPGLIPTHDGEYHVVRFYEFYKQISDGILYPRWASDLNNGYGVPLFNYVYPFPNYAASFLHILGFSFIESFKFSFIIATILAGIFFYLWVKSFFDEFSSFVASIFFLYAPYRLVNIYVRGSIGEIWALTFFSGFLWAITMFSFSERKNYFILSVVFLSLTIFSHNILAVMFFALAVGYSFLLGIQKGRKKIHLSFIGIYLWSLGITSLFWLPALLETSYVKGLEIYKISENFSELYQLIFPSWGTGFSGGELGNQMSFQIGVANLLAICGSSFLLKKSSVNKKTIVFFLIAFCIASFLILPYSELIWRNIRLLQYFQFPWRFLNIIILSSGLLAGFVASVVKNTWFRAIWIIIPVILSIGYIQPAYYLLRNDNYYITRSNFIEGTNSPGNLFNTIWMNPQLHKNPIKYALDDDSKVTIIQARNNTYIFNVQVSRTQISYASIAYFPGWKAFIDEKEVKTQYNKDGLLSFEISKGIHSLRLEFGNTYIRSVAQFISLFSVLVFVLFSYRKGKIIL